MLKRLFSSLCAVCVCLGLLLGFSVTANAEEVPDNLVEGYTIRQDVYIIMRELIVDQEIWKNFTPYDGTVTKEDYDFEEYTRYEIFANAKGQIEYRTVWNIQMQSGKNYPFQTGKLNRVTLDNFYWCYLLEDPELHYVRGFDTESEKARINVKYTDGTEETIDVTPITDSDYSLDVSFEFTPEKNVKEFLYIIDSDVTKHLTKGQNDDTEVYITSYLGEQKGDNKHEFTFTVQSEEEELMSGILGWVKNIFNKLSDMVTSIVELPTTLWNAISDGLINLFVPTAEDFTAFKDDMNTMLKEKFGALYEVGNMVFETLENMEVADEQNTVEFPKVSINLPENNKFEFGGYTVKIVPDGFDAIVVVLKSLIAMVCTAMFINGLKKRYEEVMSR